MAFDLTKSHGYKVVQFFTRLHAELFSLLFKDRKLEPVQGPDIYAISYLQRRLFKSHGSLLLVPRDDIDSKEFTIYDMVKGCPMWTVEYVVNTNEYMTSLLDRWRLFKSHGSLLLVPRDDIDSKEFTIYDMVKGCPIGILRLAFDLRKLIHYKVAQAGDESGEIWIQIYSSKTGNWSFCRDRFSCFNFDHFESATIYWNDTFHWLEGLNRELKHCKLNIEDHDHLIMTIIEIPHGFHRGRNFLESFSRPSNDLIDDIGFTEFTIYEMMIGSSVWSVRRGPTSPQHGEDPCDGDIIAAAYDVIAMSK
nr:hypothetical protein [Tanacetum cinerariifolium]